MADIGGKTKPLPEAIVRTLAFFDMFDRPLTAWEIKENLGFAASLREVIGCLEEDGGCWEERDGFYFWPGRSAIVPERRHRYNYSRRKLKIARRFARVFSWLPSVKAVFLANSLGAFNLRDGSDIDFFIVAAPGKIWTSRLYCAGIAKILGVRPTKDVKRDRICLSFYISEDGPDLRTLFLDGGDPYFETWAGNLVLLRERRAAGTRFLQASGRNLYGSASAPVRKSAEPGLFEKIAKKFQLAIMPEALKAGNGNGNIVISDRILKLYLTDRRQEYKEKYGNKIRTFFA